MVLLAETEATWHSLETPLARGSLVTAAPGVCVCTARQEDLHVEQQPCLDVHDTALNTDDTKTSLHVAVIDL